MAVAEQNVIALGGPDHCNFRIDEEVREAVGDYCTAFLVHTRALFLP